MQKQAPPVYKFQIYIPFFMHRAVMWVVFTKWPQFETAGKLIYTLSFPLIPFIPPILFILVYLLRRAAESLVFHVSLGTCEMFQAMSCLLGHFCQILRQLPYKSEHMSTVWPGWNRPLMTPSWSPCVHLG